MKENYYIEWNGKHWQSVFKTYNSEKSQLHTSLDDAFWYMRFACNVKDPITILRDSFTYKELN